MCVCEMDSISNSLPVAKRFKRLCQQETFWIYSLNTLTPGGLNEENEIHRHCNMFSTIIVHVMLNVLWCSFPHFTIYLLFPTTDPYAHILFWISHSRSYCIGCYKQQSHICFYFNLLRFSKLFLNTIRNLFFI